MKLAYHVARRPSLLLCADGNGGAVLVATRNHKDAVAAKAMIAREAIGRQKRTNDVPLVERPVGVRPRDSDEDRLRH